MAGLAILSADYVFGLNYARQVIVTDKLVQAR